MLELVEGNSKIHVFEDTLEAGGSETTKPLEARFLEDGDPEVDQTFEPHPQEETSEEAHDDSQEETQSKKTFKYKSSHPEELIIGNKYIPLKTRSALREEHSMLGLISMIAPTFVDEALSNDGWIVAMQEEFKQFQRNDV